VSTAITVYDGTNAIGGNKIFLEDGDTAVFTPPTFTGIPKSTRWTFACDTETCAAEN